ncbi:NUDIX hydrolase [Patescibacteria group bacterium]|nr:NUDIX hydrolase [Patescibacteria group bacterium]
MFEELTRAKQLEKEAGWKDPLTYAVVATILCKRGQTLAQTQFLVTTRQQGAVKGHKQSHHGGFIKPTDQNVMAAARREVREETGFILEPSDMQFLSIMGPELYRSTMSHDDGFTSFTLTITNEQAEPTAPFILTLFLADVSQAKRVSENDGEVSNQRWLSLSDIVKQYGQSMKFNYFSFLWQAMILLVGRTVPPIPPTSPGTYLL